MTDPKPLTPEEEAVWRREDEQSNSANLRIWATLDAERAARPDALAALLRGGVIDVLGQPFALFPVRAYRPNGSPIPSDADIREFHEVAEALQMAAPAQPAPSAPAAALDALVSEAERIAGITDATDSQAVQWVAGVKWAVSRIASPAPAPDVERLREALDRVMRNVVCGQWYDDNAESGASAVGAVNRLHDAEREMWRLYDLLGIDLGDAYIRRPDGWRTEADIDYSIGRPYASPSPAPGAERLREDSLDAAMARLNSVMPPDHRLTDISEHGYYGRPDWYVVVHGPDFPKNTYGAHGKTLVEALLAVSALLAAAGGGEARQ